VKKALLALPTELDAKTIYEIEVLEHQARHRRIQLARELPTLFWSQHLPRPGSRTGAHALWIERAVPKFCVREWNP
jgi:hypothetical protein